MSDDAALEAEVTAALTAAGQAHVLQPPPPPEKRAAFFRQLQQLDLPGLRKWFDTSMSTAAAEQKQVRPFTDVTQLSDLPAAQSEAARAEGLRLIAGGHVAALLLAGGQGTRLGSSAPKGCYNIGMPSNKSLFQYHCERVTAVKRLAAAHAGVPEASVRMPLLVMTSAATDAETRAVFEQSDFYGLPKAQVIFFSQGTLPCLTLEGKLMLAAPAELAEAPNGNGGVYLSLRETGVLAQLQRDGVTSIFQFGVDNVLCHVADPTFIGFCANAGAECGVKTVAKAHAHEPVGVLALADGKYAVVEYSELSKEMAEAVGASGRLEYSASHICVNWFSVAFLARFCESEHMAALPLHVAKKKIPCLGADGEMVVPEKPNGVKMELFIFDTFPCAASLVALQVPREEEFAPVKNAPGAASDSPDTARALFSQLCRRRLEAAGAQIDGDADALVEVSPLVSYQGEGLQERVHGKTLKLPLHLE